MNDELQNLEAVEELCRNLRISVEQEGAVNNQPSKFLCFSSNRLTDMHGDFTFV